MNLRTTLKIAPLAAAVAVPAVLSVPAIAQTQTPTQFVATFAAETPGEERVIERSDPVLTVIMRPELTVELTSVPNEQTQRLIGVSAENPLSVGTRLYGSSNRRSLYCHIINDRLVGSGGTCFRDFDNDGAFEQGIELEAPGLETDVVVMANNGRWYGGTFVDRERLSPPVTYRPVAADDVANYPARIIWSADVNRIDPEDYPVTLTFSLADGEPGARTDVVGRCYLTAQYSGSPVSVNFYGNTIDVLGFTEDGSMRAVVRPVADETVVGMIYRFESRSAYVGIALARNARDLPCTDAY